MRIRIVGAGTMGRGIAQWAVTAGHTAELADARTESVAEAVSFVRRMCERAVEKGRMGEDEAKSALDRLVPLDSPYAPPAAPGEAPELVIEAVLEDVEIKAGVFTELERVLPAGTVFATNTSSLPVTRIAACLADPGRLAGLHFFNPVPLMRIVEVVPGARTRDDVPSFLTAFVESCGHRAVTVADTPGFLVNHAGRGLVTEAFALLEESVAGPAALDRIARDVLGLRMGPFELMDLTGLDVTSSVMETVWDGFRHSERLRPSYLAPNRVTAGLHGRKTGRGFYAYDGSGPGPREIPEPDAGAGGDPGCGVTVVGDGAEADALRASLPAPGEDGPVLVLTWGTSVAEEVARLGLRADRAVGVDPLSLDAPRRVLAVTPATAPGVVRDAAAVLGGAVTVVRDTAGSVAQRMLASIVSVAASIAERGIATPDAIDLAVTLGLGYPKGPLEWGDAVGAGRVLRLGEALSKSTGDPRYRPTRWVRERSLLGLPLTTPMAPLPD